jgi:hypothetical protein
LKPRNENLHPTASARTFQHMTPAPSTTKSCPLCGAPLTQKEDACTRCDWIPGYQEQRKATSRRNPRDVAAAVLSLVPGAGHIFKGYVWPGVALAVGTPLVVLLTVALNLFAGWVLPLIFWPAIMMDAYFRKDRKAPGPSSPTGDS